eukprot:scaffold207776_cov32-Tisochrysis_lutea.AAC.2
MIVSALREPPSLCCGSTICQRAGQRPGTAYLGGLNRVVLLLGACQEAWRGPAKRQRQQNVPRYSMPSYRTRLPFFEHVRHDKHGRRDGL